MALLPTLEQFAVQGSEINVFHTLISLILAIIYSSILAKLYIKYGFSLSNRERFASNFVLLAITTTLVISVVKSSLALSLGMVGALSIVRFRAAIKEPEELVYLFLIITTGVGLGANQWSVTTIGFIFISLFIIGRVYFKGKPSSLKNTSILITIPNPKKGTFSFLRQILLKNCKSINLKRYDESKESIEALFLVELNSVKNLEFIRSELISISESARISILDNLS